MENKILRIPVILLAGGKSSRAGCPKGLMEIQGRSWLETQVERFKSLGGGEIVLVLGYDAEAYSEVCSKLTGVSRALNPHPEDGPFSSIQTGLKKIAPRSIDGAFILPIDVPVPEEAVWSAILSEFSEQFRIVQPVYRDGDRLRGGHPILLSKTEIDAILALPPTDRLDQRVHLLMEASPELVRRVEVFDSTILMNLNTVEDWEKFKLGSH